jgi:2-polyprenyl-3-methyl-5-hydroxy-6-metoxy-1,4-benzoquinol methylase
MFKIKLLDRWIRLKMGRSRRGHLVFHAQGCFSFEQGAELGNRLGKKFGELSRLCCLDLGCGPGESVIAREILHISWQRLISVDAFEPYLVKMRERTPSAKQHDIHLSRIEDLDALLEGLDIDLILLIDVLEHLPRRDALRLLYGLEKQVRRGIVLFSPVGEVEQGALDGNEYQRHRSFWEPGDWLRLGYDVEVYDKFHGQLDPPETAAWAIKVL